MQRHSLMKKTKKSVSLGLHGAAELPSVLVDSYNLELRDHEGFIGDRASKRAFADIIEDWRERLRRVGRDPLGDLKSDEISKKKFEQLLLTGTPEVAGLIQGAIEEFANELAVVPSTTPGSPSLNAWPARPRRASSRLRIIFGLPPSFPFFRAADNSAALRDLPPIAPSRAAIQALEPRNPCKSVGE